MWLDDTRGENHRNCKYSEQTIKLMRRYKSIWKVSNRRISDRMGIPYGTVCNIVSRNSWRHL